MFISDWSSDVCSSVLAKPCLAQGFFMPAEIRAQAMPMAAGRHGARHPIMPCLPRLARRQRFEFFYRAPQLIQEHYNPSAVEAASHENWQSRDAYRVPENATRAEGSAKPKFYAKIGR